MKKWLTVLLFFPLVRLCAQPAIDTTVKVDLLRAPASPASNLLGVAPSDIDRPTDVSAFMLSLQSAAGNLGQLPANYAVDLAPYWLFKNSRKGDVTTEGFRQSSGANVLKQTMVVSFAFRNPDSLERELNGRSAYGGLGFKFSIFRGVYDASTNATLAQIKRLQDIKLRKLDSILTNYKANVDPEVIELRQRLKAFFRPGMTAADIKAVRESDAFGEVQSALNEKLRSYAEGERTEAGADLDRQIQRLASSFQLTRTGFTWELAGGIGGEFRNKNFDNLRMYNAGVWTTVGYTDTTYGAGLAIVRLLNNPKRIFARGNAPNKVGDITTLDAGIRYLYAKPQSKFSASVEAIYRSVLSSETIEPSWRFVFNADYAIWANQKLTFSFGRNFDGTITKDGNLIAALSFLTGFGNNR